MWWVMGGGGLRVVCGVWWVVGVGGGRGGWWVAGRGWRVVVDGGSSTLPLPCAAEQYYCSYDWITPDHLLEVNPVCVGVYVCVGGGCCLCVCVCVCVCVGGGEGYCVILPCNPQLPTL